MKFTTALIIASLTSSAVAFSPSGGNKRVFTKSGAASVSSTNPATNSNNNKNGRKIFDPLGLYGKNTVERKSGVIQPLESSADAATDKYVIDPLSLYSGRSKDQVSTNADMSASVPFLPRPKLLDGSLPGDRGFDPLNFINDDESTLKWMVDAETKHNRLAMLAAVGWPLSELYHKLLATNFDLPSILNVQDKVPSVLNGGLDATNPLFWVAAISAAAAIEFTGTKLLDQGKQPGDFGFDPLGFLKNKSDDDKFFWKEAEVFNGRLAQLAVLSYVIIEAITGSGIINETPKLFGL